MSSDTYDGREMRPSDAPGGSVERREDPPLLTGEAEYADDLQYPDSAHVAILRSQYAHARVRGIDTSAVGDLDGVVAVYTREDLLEAGLSGEMPGDDAPFAVDVDRPLLAGDRVRYQGDSVAAVVAEDRYTAHEALDLIDVEYERVEDVTEAAEALADGAPSVHDDAPGNVAFEWSGGDREATGAVFEEAADVVEVDLAINRVAAVPMEPRAVVARYEPASGDLTVEPSCQNVVEERSRLAAVLGLPERKVHVKAPAVGGGFGVKSQSYAGTYLAAFAAVQLGRPVKWAATRSQAFLTTNHSRRHDVRARAALDAEGRWVGLHVSSTANVGAYLTEFGALVPAAAFGTRLLGQYDVPEAYVEVTGAFTNTTTLGPYRGAGRPEAAYTIERLADACARARGEDPVAFRRRNQIPPDAFPYETPFGTVYDSGDYGKALDTALDLVDYDAARKRQAEAREEGRHLGIGLSTYLEICGDGPGSVQGGHVRMSPSGSVVAATSTVENGQGHGTSYARVVAETLGVPVEDVEVVEGDTDRVPEGGGTGGSRSMPVGGSALRRGAEAVRERARRVAANELEAAPEDVEFDAAEGAFSVAGAPDRSLAIKEVAEAAYSAGVPESERGLEETVFYSPEAASAPFGTHVAIVEVDPDTGDVEIERYVAVDDCGVQIEPDLVEGQIQGGIVQSVGQALYEEAVYDENGNLATGSLSDYAVPKAFHAPEIEWDSTVTPSPNNPLGVKGVGEAGTIAAMPAVVNAVVDALAPLGVDPDDLQMPLTPERVWRAIREADGG